MPETQLFITADDRTGALEIGGIIASSDTPVPVGLFASDDRCCVVDLNSRHMTHEDAATATRRAHKQAAVNRCHKMDSGLRGNWPYEIAALTEMGYKVAVIPAFPEAGRRCKDGVVYIDDVPVLESPFGKDPLSAPTSSRPLDMLESSGCLHGDVVVWDANDSYELRQAVARCRTEGRLLVGPTGAIGEYARTILGERESQRLALPRPVLVVCGSLNVTSREQLSRLGIPLMNVNTAVNQLPDNQVTVLLTEEPKEPVGKEAANLMAMNIAAHVQTIPAERYKTLFLIGGDTASAIIGDVTVNALGNLAPGIPVARFGSTLLVTKGGGIGNRDTLLSLFSSKLVG